MTRRRGATGLAVLAVAALSLVACAPPTPVERGAALFDDPGLSESSSNAMACSTCHVPGAIPAGRIPVGGSLAGVTQRPSFFGGGELDLRAAINFCLRRFMRAPAREPLRADDPRGRDLLSYLETLDGPPDAVPFTLGDLADDLPPGDAARGAATWDAACRNCHGAPSTGADRLAAYVTLIPDATIEEHGDEARIRTIEKVRNGQFYGAGGEMPPFSLERLSDAELADVLSFLALER